MGHEVVVVATWMQECGDLSCSNRLVVVGVYVIESMVCRRLVRGNEAVVTEYNVMY